MVIGSTLYVGSTDGTVYALDTATGDEQWRVDTGSAIVTGLVNEDSVLYFAMGPATAQEPVRRSWRWIRTAWATTCSATRSRTPTPSCSPRVG